MKTVGAQDAEPLADPIPLRSRRDAGELRHAARPHQAAPAARAKMAIAVEGDGGADGFKRLYLQPEFGIRERMAEPVVAIVGNHGQDRLESEVLNEVDKALPTLGRNGRTQIIQTEQILRRFWQHTSLLSF
jgi:hypothetical protein